MDPKWTPELQIVRKIGTPKKTTKNKPLKSRQKQQNSLKLGPPGATKVQPNCNFFRNFLHPGPEMGQESSQGPKRLAQGVQKVPKGFQKATKRQEKDIQKASARHPNAMSKCIGNSIGNSISNAIANAIATDIHLPSAFPPPCLGLR